MSFQPPEEPESSPEQEPKKGKAPGDLEVTEQKVEVPQFATVRALPLCQWPAWPHYKSGPANVASSFVCAK